MPHAHGHAAALLEPSREAAPRDAPCPATDGAPRAAPAPRGRQSGARGGRAARRALPRASQGWERRMRRSLKLGGL